MCVGRQILCVVLISLNAILEPWAQDHELLKDFHVCNINENSEPHIDAQR